MPQELLSLDLIDKLCQDIKQFDNCSELIISLCPNTEPMKSAQSRSLIYHIIKELCSRVKFIQISTKEYIPKEFLCELNELTAEKDKIRISISLPYVSDTDKIEPGAASIEKRLENFSNIKQFPAIVSILYLRPFNQQMITDKNKYVDFILKYTPDEICLGAEFVPKVETEQLCTFMYDNNLAPSIFKSADINDIFSFAEYIRKETGYPIFFSSICNIANHSDYGCILELYKHDKRYCSDCILPK